MATITSRTLPLRDWGNRNGNSATFRPQWHRTAPKTVARADNWDDQSAGWAIWTAHLTQRREPCPLTALLPSKGPSLLWGMRADSFPTASHGSLATQEMLTALDRSTRNKAWKTAIGPADLAHRWSSEALHRRSSSFGLECLAWCRALPALSGLLPAGAWWHLFEILLSAAENSASPTDSNVELLSRQWLAAELPLTMAYLFPEISQTRRLAREGARGVFADIEPAITADGMPSAQTMAHVLPLLATWARARAIARCLKKSNWDDAAETRYAAFARQVVRLLRRDGTAMLSPARSEPADRELFAAVFVGADRADRAMARQAIPGQSGPSGVAVKALPAPAANNESAGVTVLRPNWSRSRERLAVTRHGNDLRTELACGRDVLWSGVWTCEIRRNGVPLVPEPDAEWDEVCWTSTEDADYLELELALPNNIRVQRQMVLAREDRFLFLADAILGDESASLEYRSVLPLSSEITFDAATESREGYLVGRKARALVFPLALPEWRAEPCPGGLEAVDGGLALRRATTGSRMYAPLFLDLDPQRLVRPATWRQLTVAETRRTLPADLAVGYRVQVRNKQWLIYRSLGERGNRTVLGQNLVSEFLVARFNTTGVIEPLVEIE
ncbi:MAG TPA: hypothetical protein VGG64_09045 [Pirellulales bacterium]